MSAETDLSHLAREPSCPVRLSTRSPASTRRRRTGSRRLRAAREPVAPQRVGHGVRREPDPAGKSAAAAAVQATASRGTSFTALDVKINFLQAVAADGRELLATGTVLHRGKRLAIATADVMHGDVRVAVLTGTTALTPSASPA